MAEGDAVQAEMKSLLVGLRLIHSRDLIHTPIIIEGDLTNAIGWMKYGNSGPWCLSHLIKEATFLVCSMNSSFVWIPKEANLVADGLAKREVNKEVLFSYPILEEPQD